MTNSLAEGRLPKIVGAALLAAFLVLPIVGYGVHFSSPTAWKFSIFHVGLVTPLFWRRRYPEATFLVIAAVAFLQWIFAEPLPGDAALLVALFTVASTRPLRRTVAAAAILELGVLLADIDHHGVLAKIFGFIFLSGLTAAAALLGINAQTRRAYLHEVEERAARLEVERDQQAQLAVAAERTRLAREMHDIVAHNIAVMVALTDGAALTVESDPQRARSALQEASAAGRAALTDVRRLLGLLREGDGSEPDGQRSPAPRLDQLEDLIETVRRTGLDVRYKSGGPIGTLPEAVQMSGYRIVQEALTNVMKHARDATHVSVDVRSSKKTLVIAVQDDGRTEAESRYTASGGTRPTTSGGHGLAGIRERATLHRGTVHIGPTRKGWKVLVTLHSDGQEAA